MAGKKSDGWTQTVVEADDRPEGTQSIQRAFMVLRIVAAGGDSGLGLTDIARATGLARPTSHRVLRALMAEGVVEQKSRTRRYAVVKHIQFASLSRPSSSPLLQAAVPHLNDAAAEIGDTLFLTVRAGLETLCVARRLGGYPVQVLLLDAGVSRPLGVSSAGIALLATMRPPVARRIVLQNARHLPSYDLTVEESLAAVSRAKAAGYALRERGLAAGTRAVSVAFGNHKGEAAAALTIAAIARRLQPQRVQAIVERLRACTERIEQSLPR